MQEKTNWYHRGVELTMQQLDVLEPLQKKLFKLKGVTLDEFERQVDQLLSSAGCGIDMKKRKLSRVESGLGDNTYYWQIDTGKIIISNYCDAQSMQDVCLEVIKKHAISLPKRSIPEDLSDRFPSDPACPQLEVGVDRWRIRITLMLGPDGGMSMNAAMLNHKIIAK